MVDEFEWFSCNFYNFVLKNIIMWDLWYIVRMFIFCVYIIGYFLFDMGGF